MRKFYKVTGEKWSCSEDPFKVVQCGRPQEMAGEKDDFSCTDTVSGLNQLPPEAPVLLKQIK